MSSGNEILTRLEDAGRTLLFVDESGTTGKPLPNLEKDYMVYCGVEICSANYSKICKCMNERLLSINSDVQEFHATEIVNPKKTSPWYKASHEERIDSLLLLKELIYKYCTVAPYCYISKKQYCSLVIGTDFEGLSHKEGLKKVFFNSVLSTKRTENKNYAVIFDSEKKLNNEIKIQNVSLDDGLLYENGVILAPSVALPGLQLADYAVYILNRIHHSAHRVKTGKNIKFDEIIIESANMFKSKYMDLLKK